MRVTAETQAATRARILEAARRLFAANSFEDATTRDIAREAEIAVGTLFNYFPAKEAIVASLAEEAALTAHREFADTSGGGDSLEEDLFALVAAGLRNLKPLRKHLPAVLETALSPLAMSRGETGESLRALHLETVTRLANDHGFAELSTVALQMYWSLYIGVLLFWAGDKSPRQEDTLALLDSSLRMFVGWLKNGENELTANDLKEKKK